MVLAVAVPPAGELITGGSGLMMMVCEVDGGLLPPALVATAVMV